MPVSITDLIQTLKAQFTEMQIETDAENDAVMFMYLIEQFFAPTAIRIYNCDPIYSFTPQAIALSLVFTDTEGEVLDFTHKDYTEVVMVCSEIQQSLDWGIITPCQTENNTTEVTLYRSIQTSSEDITRAIEGDLSSQLNFSLVYLAQEFRDAALILQNYSSTDNFQYQMLILCSKQQQLKILFNSTRTGCFYFSSSIATTPYSFSAWRV